MKNLLTGFVLTFITSVAYSQPSTATIKADIQKDMGPNCSKVEIIGSGSTKKEFVNGVWVTYYRIPVHATLKTEMNNVTRLMKGAAWYSVNGNTYSFKKYNPGTGEYIGLPAPDVTAIKTFVSSLPDYGLGGLANIVTEVNELEIRNTPAVWHTLLSVSVPADITYVFRKNNTQLEKVKEPYDIRLYRLAVNSSWNSVTFIKPNPETDSRSKISLGVETISEYKMSQIKTLVEKNLSGQNENHKNSLPEVTIPTLENTKQLAEWLNSVFIEENPEKAEKLLLQLLYRNHFNNAGLLNPDALQMMQNLKNAVKNDFSSYKKQYCTSVKIKEQTANSVEWWNKDKTKSSRCSTVNENGRWFITELRVGLWDFHFEKYAIKTSDTVCF
jgi:hypothetical protein